MRYPIKSEGLIDAASGRVETVTTLLSISYMGLECEDRNDLESAKKWLAVLEFALEQFDNQIYNDPGYLTLTFNATKLRTRAGQHLEAAHGAV